MLGRLRRPVQRDTRPFVPSLRHRGGNAVQRPAESKYGMVIDFGVLKRIVGGPHRGCLRPQPSGKTCRRQRRTDKNARRTVRQAAGGGIPAYVRKPRHAFRGDHRGRASREWNSFSLRLHRNGHLPMRNGSPRTTPDSRRNTAAATPQPLSQTQPETTSGNGKTIPTRRIRPDIRVLLPRFMGRPMRNRQGINTSAVFGFTKFLRDILMKEAPRYMGVALRLREERFRNELYPQYKANRAKRRKTS